MEERILRCRKCNERKPATQFAPQKNGRGGRHVYCRPCATEVTRQWRKNNPEKFRTQQKRTARNRALKQYGLNEYGFEDLLEIQGNSCAICKTEFSKTPAIDHSHETNAVRGLLCHTCNVGLGMFKDSIDVMLSAIEYLKKHS